ncbi:hypothetical protein L6R53_33280, partial [Myxococcota bacterium]|nr:hypothetical protein [Myxococcota bacterium]
ALAFGLTGWLLQAPRDRRRQVALALVLEPDVLRVEGSDWRLPLEEVSTMHVFMQRRLMIRAGDRLWEAEIPTGSVVRWQWEVEAQIQASQRR